MCESRTGNHSDTRICIRPYFVEWKAQHFYGWLERFFWVEKKTSGSTALKQYLTDYLILFSNLKEILPIRCNLRYTGHLLGVNFGGD